MYYIVIYIYISYMYIIHVHILTSVPPEFVHPARRLAAPRTAPGRASEWVDPGRSGTIPKSTKWVLIYPLVN